MSTCERGCLGTVSRRCRAVRGHGRAADRAASSARTGPTTRIRRTTSGPTAAASRASSCRCRVRSWVAQAVDSACSTSSPSRSADRRAVVGDVRADQLRPAARARWRRSAAATSRGPATPGRPAGRTAAGRARPGPDPDHRRRRPRTPRPPAAPGRGALGGRWRHAAPRPPAPRAGPPGRGRPRARRPSHDRQSSCVVPRAGDNRWAIGPGERFAAARRAVVLPRQHHWCRSYPQYPQRCPQPCAIMRSRSDRASCVIPGDLTRHSP